MLPAYVDFWCQTSPRPTPDPEVSLFIHGPEAGEPDVQVCWRAELVEDDHIKQSAWCDIVGLLPPTSAECMSVPISRVRKWLTKIEDTAPESDLLGTATSSDDEDSRKGKRQPRPVEPSRAGVLWRGSKQSRIIRSPDELRPDDTLVLPATSAGWDVLERVFKLSVSSHSA